MTTPPHRDHTEGSIILSILRMGVPSMIGFGIGNVYDLVDMYWLSRLGPAPVAAVTILGPFLWVLHSANMVVGAGSVAVISRRYGEGDIPRTSAAIRDTLLLKWLVAILFGALGYLLTPSVVRLLGAQGETVGMSVRYGRIIFLGLGFNFATYSVFTALRGVANPNKAMLLMIALSCLNMLLDPLFIFGWGALPGLGIAGAALASVISYALAFAAGLLLLTRGGANIRVVWRGGEPIQWAVMWRMLKIGIPSAIGSISFSLARLAIMPLVAVFGMGVVAAYGVGTRISAFGVMMLVGVGLGLSALIGHNVGAGKLARARRTANQALLLSTGIMTLFALIAFTAAGPIVRCFFDDPTIVACGVPLLRILALGFPFLGIYLTIENVYAGVGENRPTMVFNIITAWALEVPGIYVATKLLGWGPQAVWWILSGAVAISSLAFCLYFRRGKWLTVKV